MPADSPEIDGADLSLWGDGGPLYAYQARPRGVFARRPAVIVIHENRGLVEHIRDVTRRIARAGFVGLGVDLLSRQGGTAQFTDATQQGAAYGRTRPEERRADLINALLFLKDQPYVRGDRIGAVGFCAGGQNCFDLAVSSPDLTAAVVFYGTSPTPPELFANMSARLLMLFAELDAGITGRVQQIVPQLMASQKRFGLHVYENARHAFHNDTGPNYDAAVACDAWGKTIEFFNRHLNA
jgi:carboxymethylenebutenolidase